MVWFGKDDEDSSAPSSPPPEAPSPQSGRPDHLKSLIRRNQSTRAERMAFASTVLESIGEEDIDAGDEEQVLPPAQASEVSGTAAAAADGTAPRPGLTAAERRVSRRTSQYAQRQSVFQAQAPERLVEVRLRDVSCYVPVKMDAPSVKTVANQSVCYGAFEFVRRLHQFCQSRSSGNPTGSADKETEAEEAAGQSQPQQQWEAKTSSDVVSPYGQKAILHNIDLVLKPGKVYLILGPPGCGKTSLLKCIAGLLPNAAAYGAEPKKHQSYQSGRVEFNGVATEVSSIELTLNNYFLRLNAGHSEC